MASRRLAALGVVATVSLAACAAPAAPHAAPDPAIVEEIEGPEGSDLHRITLTERAAERLGIETAPAEMAAVEGSASDRLVIPYSAVFYTADGSAWAYTNPEPLVYMRAPLDVDYVADDLAVLADGEEAMTVVSVGAVELYGAESGLGAGAH
jgi:hypothetical protein